MKTPSSKQSLILLFSVIAVSFGLHAAYLSSQSIDLGTHLTWQAYLFNVLAASIILVFKVLGFFHLFLSRIQGRRRDADH